MGLSEQHWAQQVLLACCYHLDVAVAVVEVVTRCLECPVVRAGISSAASPLWAGEDFEAWIETFWGRLRTRVHDLPLALEGSALTRFQKWPMAVQQVYHGVGARVRLMCELCGQGEVVETALRALSP